MRKNNKKLILLTNDDGIEAKGINALYEVFSKVEDYDVRIIAPQFERSAVGHGITVFDPIWVKKEYRNNNFYGYVVNGTPADCVKLHKELIGEKPDLLVSGINRGSNIGENIIYSGTVSAAMEGVCNDIPSIAVSLDSYIDADYTFAAKFSKKISEHIFKNNGLPPRMLLNVNIPLLPENEIKGVKITKQSDAKFKDFFLKRTDPRGRDYYWIDGEFVEITRCDDSDYCAIREGYVSITPIHYDMTDYNQLDFLKKWRLQLD